jgi:hypothetical protein
MSALMNFISVKGTSLAMVTRTLPGADIPMTSSGCVKELITSGPKISSGI